MNFKYTTTIVMLLMILALSRGVVLHYQDFIHFDALTAHAEGDGGGGAGGGGDGGGGAGGGGDGAGGAGDTPAPSGDIGGGDITPVYGCMDFTATNYDASATSQTGITCTYVAVVYGCMDSTATNYNPSATSQTGITCTYVAVVYGCMDSTATNYNSSATSQTGITCTYPPAIVWTNYCTGGNDIHGNNWQIWAHTADYTGWKFIEEGTISNGCVAPAVPIYGCMDSTATNYNSHATSQTGVICTYPVAPVYGCTDSTATNYNPSATIDDWSCTYPVAPIYGCMDSTATNYNPSATSQTGITCTYPAGPGPAAPACVLTATPTSVTTGSTSTLSWTTSNASTFSINSSIGNVTPVSSGSTTTPAILADTTFTGTATNSAGSTVTCTATVTVTALPPPPSSPSTSSSGGSHRGSSRAPAITLAALPHVGAQPLAYLYLSQIPQTGLELGPVATIVYWLVLIGIAFAFAYLMLFGAAPIANRSLRNFGSRVSLALNAQELAPAQVMHSVPPAPVQHEAPEVFAEAPEATRGYSSYDGFKSFAKSGALSIEDIVKGLAREQGTQAIHAPAEPIYEHVEPMYENVEPVMNEVVPEKGIIPADVRGFTAALLEGDRVAVFAGLRQHVRGSGASEQLISSVVCLLDDAYRARIDGSACDPDIARMTARLSTPILENLIASLTTAIDSSYSTGVTGAKLALTRALAILGA